jgi:hypothetical protein
VRKGGGVLVVGSGGSGILPDVEEEERGGIPKRYGCGLHSTRRTKIVRYLGLNLMNSLLGVAVVAVNLLSHRW